MPYPTLQDTDLILDTETTGLGRYGEDDVLELAIVDGLGQVLFDQRLRPLSKTSWLEAERIHGITPAMVKDLGTLGDHWPTVRPLLCDPGRRIFVYNKNFDFPMVCATLKRSSGAAAVDELAGNHAAWQCAMLAYAQFAGVPGRYSGEFKWHKLTDAARRMGVETGDTPAHSALGDALVTQRLLVKMRETPDRHGHYTPAIKSEA